MRSILDALQEGRLFELPDSDKGHALEFLARIIDANPAIEVGTDTIEEVKIREEQCNTGIGLGVAVPHIRARREDGSLFCAIGWSVQGIDYGAPDSARVHLVFMYYIPGAQKNVYLKEISNLVKAIRKSGGIEPIVHANDLNVVRNLLIDWVGEAVGDSGPEAVARMIKLEVKQAQLPPEVRPGVISFTLGRVTIVEILVAGPLGAVVLAHDADWAAAVERDSSLAQRLAAGAPFIAAGRQLFVTESTAFAGGRRRYLCVALDPAAPTP